MQKDIIITYTDNTINEKETINTLCEIIYSLLDRTDSLYLEGELAYA